MEIKLSKNIPNLIIKNAYALDFNKSQRTSKDYVSSTRPDMEYNIPGFMVPILVQCSSYIFIFLFSYKARG